MSFCLHKYALSIMLDQWFSNYGVGPSSGAWSHCRRGMDDQGKTKLN